MDQTAVRKRLQAELDQVNKLILDSLESDIELLNRTNRALLDHPGKQLRPILALLVARAIGGRVNDDTLRFAAASELLHNATLLHDDVADGSAERRGRPTVMSLLGSRASVLLGDFWLVRAVARILEASRESNRVIRIFADTLADLAEGEMLQLQKASAGDTQEADYQRIIYNKTASLFVAAALSAAISAQATPAQEEAVRSYAENLGMAFQIKDDIFDYQENASIGKPVGQDLQEQKITLPLLGALQAAPEQGRLTVGNTEIDLKCYEVRVNGESVLLSPKEVEILHLMAAHLGQVFTREQLLDSIWGFDFDGDSRVVDTSVNRIRKKLPENSSLQLKSVYGVGYKLEEKDNAAV